MHPAVAKAQHIARRAKELGWHGSIDSDVTCDIRTTFLNAKRNDERIHMIWRDNVMIGATYSIFGFEVEIACASEVLKRVEGEPDIVELVKQLTNGNLGRAMAINQAVQMCAKYKQIPWDENTPKSLILGKLKGKHIWWYSELTGKIRDEFITEPKKKSQVYNMKCIAGEYLLNFCTVDTGLRSVKLDTILKVV